MVDGGAALARVQGSQTVRYLEGPVGDDARPRRDAGKAHYPPLLMPTRVHAAAAAVVSKPRRTAKPSSHGSPWNLVDPLRLSLIHI